MVCFCAESFVPSVPFICSNDSWFVGTIQKLHRPEDPVVRSQTQLQGFPPRHANAWPTTWSLAGRRQSMDSYGAHTATGGSSSGAHPMDKRPVLAGVLCAVVLVLLAAGAAVVRRVQQARPCLSGGSWLPADDRRKALLQPRGIPLVRPPAGSAGTTLLNAHSAHSATLAASTGSARTRTALPHRELRRVREQLKHRMRHTAIALVLPNSRDFLWLSLGDLESVRSTAAPSRELAA